MLKSALITYGHLSRQESSTILLDPSSGYMAGQGSKNETSIEMLGKSFQIIQVAGSICLIALGVPGAARGTTRCLNVLGPNHSDTQCPAMLGDHCIRGSEVTYP